MTSNRTQLIARLSILTALTVVLGYYTKQGYFAGFKGKARYLGLLLATVVMVGGYALASALFLGNGWGAAISDIPNNLAQNFVGMALGYVVYYAFQKKGS